MGPVGPVSPTPLDNLAIARFAAVNGLDLADALDTLKVMSVRSRATVAQMFNDETYLSDDARIMSDSLSIRMAIKDLAEQRSVDARSCPYLEGTAEYGNWHAELHNQNGSCTCHGRLKEY